MIIDTSLVDGYLKRSRATESTGAKDGRYVTPDGISNASQHWIFKGIVEGKHLYEEVCPSKADEIEFVLNLFLEEIESFQPYNLDIWNALYGEFDLNSVTNKIHLIVGAPYPYDAMVMQGQDGEPCLIFDLHRILQNTSQPDKLRQIIRGFLTHELSHIFFHRRLPFDVSYDSVGVLKYIALNEGLAHFLSYSENVLDVDFRSVDMIARRENACRELTSYLKNPESIDDAVIAKSCSGKYWDKFAAVSGMFLIHDICIEKKVPLSAIFDMGIDIKRGLFNV